MIENFAYSRFSRKVLSLTGIDLNRYKSTQMERRLQTMMKRVGVDGYGQYETLLDRDPRAVKELKDFITINVSEFLRNPDKFEELKTSILPGLLKVRSPLKVWSAGCSNGAEPYSVSLILDEIDPLGHHRILATDLDEEILKVARAGLYGERDLKNVDERRRARHFRRVGDLWQVGPGVMSRVQFEGQNLLTDKFPGDLDLILCRNVVIYFTEETKDDLYRRFHQALRPGGVFFVGGTESILRAREIGFETLSPFFYRKVPGGVGGS